MPPFYEEAAHLLRILTGVGLAIAVGVDPRIVLFQLAECMHILRKRTHRQCHSDAALWILKAIEASGNVHCDPARRAKVLAVLGTAIGNFLTMQAARR